ncbi:universal stress protein [Halapricum hydrolyticum]|uniref:Universal stress protein n=1 Tax=Halapricum hydrolyticum TaxID=2979991 RepID=A0AAE3ICI7_9EURY|nr:universal stress protein [Halapricum hydrolyticum]MCU4718871.1 universal stress protein [Halapricum hydrolyticum]MCU4727851.1 universal stress protein [Halapricum hydrolyticum]
MYDRILVPVDGSQCGRDAAAYGFAFAAATGASIDLVHVVDTTLQTVGGRLSVAERREHGESILESTLELADERDDVETHLREGTPGEEIVSAASEIDADLIVMGRQGHHNLRDRLLGGVTETVVHRADPPVLVVPLGTDGAAANPSRLVVPTDGSENAAAAVPEATDLARAFDAELAVLTVVDVQAAGGSFSAGGVTQEFLERLEKEGETIVTELAATIERRAPDIPVETAVERGIAHEVIGSFASETGAGLIVMASHGRTGLRRQLIGNVADRVLRVAETPVLIVSAEK